MQVSGNIQDEMEYAANRDFILGYQFLGYLGCERNGKVVRAIEIGTNTEVAIKFIKILPAKGINYEMLIPFLVNHKTLLHLYACRPLGSLRAYIMEFCKRQSLSTYIASNGTLGSGTAIKVFIQLLDTVNYLSQHNIAHNGISSESILIDDDFNIKIGNFGQAIFYDSSEEHESVHSREDILSIGKCLYTALMGPGEDPLLCEPLKLGSKIEQINSPTLKNTLKYIFLAEGEKSIAEIYKINSLRLVTHKKSRKQVALLDLLAVEQLEQYGLERSQLEQNVNDPAASMHYIYTLCSEKIAREICPRASIRSIKAQDLRTVSTFYNSFRRRRELLGRREELLAGSVEEYSTLINCLHCTRNNARSKISMNLLVEERFWDILAILKGRNIAFYKNNDGICAIVERIGLEVAIAKTRRQGCTQIVFNKLAGWDNDLVELVDRVIAGFLE